MSSGSSVQAPHPFDGISEMHRRVNAYDWVASPLGPVSQWPQSLRATVTTLLASRYPMVLTWGPGFVQFYNDAYAQLIGDKHPGALGEDIRITLAEGWDVLGPMIARVMETGVANWMPALLLLLARNGYREESYFSVSHAPARGDDGRVAGMLAVCSEVTEQVLAERRTRLLREVGLRAGETRNVEDTCRDFAAALAGNPLDLPFALLYLRGPDGHLTLRQSVGLPSDSVGEWPLAEAMAGTPVGVGDAESRVSVRGGPWGDAVHSAWVMPIPGSGQGGPLGVLVAGLNPNRPLDEGYTSFLQLLVSQISVGLRNAHAWEEEARRAEALAELDRAKTAFFSNVSHEFRTPLTLLLGPVEDALADLDTPLPPPQRERFELVRRNALRLSKLVNSLLEFSRFEAGRVRARFVPTDLTAFTAELASLFESATQRAGLTLSVNCERMPQTAWVDREAWERIVLNLLSNALKFTLKGSITVWLRAEEGAARLSVKDTGAGIPSAELPRLFERFRRVEGVPARSHEGSGIGLALVRELTALHGGRVDVSSTPGEGSTFTVTIPLGNAHLPSDRLGSDAPERWTAEAASGFVEEARAWGSKPQTQTAAPSAPGRGRVLLVDDNADLQTYIRGALSDLYEVELASDGLEALAAIRRAPPDLVLSDVMMPRLSGFGLLREVRADARLRATPFILLSARAGEEAAVEGLDAGADDYLVKPFSTRELQARVRTQMEMARIRREVARYEAGEVALKRELAARDEFLSAASHELKTPLQAFGLQLELLDRALSPESRGRGEERLRAAKRQLGRLGELVETLLDVAAVSAGRLELRREPVDLSALARAVIERESERAAQAGCALTLQAPTPVDVPCDAGRIGQVLASVLHNAFKFGAGLPVEVTVERTDEGARVRVRDRGLGFPPEDLARIFGRFERAASIRHYGGLGAGLWLAREILRAHGGSIDAISAPGQGAVFTLTLPGPFGASE